MKYQSSNQSAGAFFICLGITVLVLSVGYGHCQTLPDTPQPQNEPLSTLWHQSKAEPAERVGFWTVGRYDRPAPLRTNREIRRSKSFWLEELALYGSAFAEMDVARGGRQNPPVPFGRDLWVDAFAPLPAISFFHFLGRKYICQCIGDGAVLGGTVWNLYSAGKQYYH